MVKWNEKAILFWYKNTLKFTHSFSWLIFFGELSEDSLHVWILKNILPPNRLIYNSIFHKPFEIFFYMSGTILSTMHVLTYLIPVAFPHCKYYYSHFVWRVNWGIQRLVSSSHLMKVTQLQSSHVRDGTGSLIPKPRLLLLWQFTTWKWPIHKHTE